MQDIPQFACAESSTGVAIATEMANAMKTALAFILTDVVDLCFGLFVQVKLFTDEESDVEDDE